MSPPDSPLVSIVIPLYNKNTTVLRAISSALEQCYSNFELVIVDDGSTDNGPELIKTFHDDRILIITQKNAGPGAARNNGVAAANGDLIAFLDADDEWRPGYLQSAVSMLIRHPTAKAYVCGYDAGQFRWARPNKIEQLAKDGLYFPPIEDNGKKLKLHVDAMHSSCVVVYRDKFIQLGGYFTRNKCRYGEDSFLWLSLLLSEGIIWDPRELVLFHVEDSALGFATTKRTIARPISLYPDELKQRVPINAHEAADRAIRTFAEMDFYVLKNSREIAGASRLRRQHGLSHRGTWAEALIDRLIRMIRL